MFTINMLPAGRGDCLWIEYGKSEDSKSGEDKQRVHRVLIDGGVPGTRDAILEKLKGLPAQRLDLLVITHIDLDHIGGVLELLRDPPPNLQVDDIWFNGWKHLPEDPGLLGAKQGESVSALIEHAGYSWNKAFGGHAVTVGDYDVKLPTRKLAGGMCITLLSPKLSRLADLAKAWAKELRAKGLKPGEAGEELEELGAESAADPGILGFSEDIEALARRPLEPDRSVANGSSIALIAEYDGKRCLLAGDAFPEDIVVALRKFGSVTGDDIVPLDAFKVAHHGGRKNTSNQALDFVACNRFLFSTDGSYYEHPHAESIARVILHGAKRGNPLLCFNYRVEQTEIWGKKAGLASRRYTPEYPPPGVEGLTVTL